VSRSHCIKTHSELTNPYCSASSSKSHYYIPFATIYSTSAPSTKAAFDWKSIDQNFEFRPEYHGNNYDEKFDFYSMLEIMPSASNAEIKEASRQKSLTVHPDKGGKKEHFQAMQAFTEWFLEPGKPAAYNKHQLGYINRHRPVIIILKSGQVKETGKEAFNWQKKENLQRKYERPANMDWVTTAEPPTKKRKTAYSTSYQPAQPIPPTQGYFSIGSHSLSKKQRKMKMRAMEGFFD
jgi:curved DNA-binding protein CbpA